jgi:hypothetical protein
MEPNDLRPDQAPESNSPASAVHVLNLLRELEMRLRHPPVMPASQRDGAVSNESERKGLLGRC